MEDAENIRCAQRDEDENSGVSVGDEKNFSFFLNNNRGIYVITIIILVTF